MSLIKKIIVLFFLLLVSVMTVEVHAQCPMCKASAEASLKEGSTAAKGINRGILYMLAAPYLLVGVIGFLWYKNHKKTQAS